MEIQVSIPESAIFFWANYDSTPRLISFHPSTGFKGHKLPSDLPRFQMPQILRISATEILIVDSRHYSKKRITIPIGRNLDLSLPACIFDFESNKITPVSPYQGNNDFKLILLNSKVHAVGYYGEILGQLWELDLSTKKWTKMRRRTSDAKKGAVFVNGFNIHSIENNLRRSVTDLQSKICKGLENKLALTIESPHLCAASKPYEIIIADSKKTFWYDLKQEKLKFLHRSKGKVIGLLVDNDMVYIFDKRLSYAKYSLASDEVVEFVDSSTVPLVNFPVLQDIDLLFKGRTRYVTATSPSISVDLQDIDGQSLPAPLNYDRILLLFGSDGEPCLRSLDTQTQMIQKHFWKVTDDYLLQNKIEFCVQQTAGSMRYYTFSHSFLIDPIKMEASDIKPIAAHLNFNNQSFFSSNLVLSSSFGVNYGKRVHRLAELNFQTGEISVYENGFQENGNLIAFSNRQKVFVANTEKRTVEFREQTVFHKTILKYDVKNTVRYMFEAMDGNVMFIDNTATVYKLWLNEGADNAAFEIMNGVSNVTVDITASRLLITPKATIFIRGERILILLYSNDFLLLKDDAVVLVRYDEVDCKKSHLEPLFGSDSLPSQTWHLILTAHRFPNPSTYFML